MTNEEKEQKALLCVRSLSNISKDLKELDQDILSEMCLFIANGILQVHRKPEIPIGQVHGNAPHDTNIKNEILNVVKQVKSGFAQPTLQPYEGTQPEDKNDFVPPNVCRIRKDKGSY